MDAAIAPALRVLLEWIGAPALWATLLGIGLVLEVFKRLVGPTDGKRGWRGVVAVTMPLYPVALGCLVGLIPGLPVPGSFGHTAAGAVVFYASAGIGASVGYDVVRRGLVNALQRFAGSGGDTQ